MNVGNYDILGTTIKNKVIDTVNVKTLVKTFATKKLNRFEINRLTTYVIPDVADREGVTYSGTKPKLRVGPLKISMREVHLFLFK